jgi:hypothetical protein
MIKALKKLVIEGVYVNIAKTKHDKPIAIIVLSGENETAFSEVRSKTNVSTLPTLIGYSAGILIQINKAREKKQTEHK